MTGRRMRRAGAGLVVMVLGAPLGSAPGIWSQGCSLWFAGVLVAGGCALLVASRREVWPAF